MVTLTLPLAIEQERQNRTKIRKHVVTTIVRFLLVPRGPESARSYTETWTRFNGRLSFDGKSVSVAPGIHYGTTLETMAATTGTALPMKTFGTSEEP